MQHWLSLQDAAEELSLVVSVLSSRGWVWRRRNPCYLLWTQLLSITVMSRLPQSPVADVLMRERQEVTEDVEKEEAVWLENQDWSSIAKTQELARSQKDWKRHRIDSPTELQKGTQPFPYKNVLELTPFVSFLFPQLVPCFFTLRCSWYLEVG